MNKTFEIKHQAQDFTVTNPCLLLQYLLEHIRGKSRNNIKSMLSRGQVLVDGRRSTRFDHALTVGQKVTVLDYLQTVPKLPFEILYEDDELIAINKPAGLLSIATEKEKNLTAYRILNDYVRASRPDARIFVMHRLDRDTSGVLLFAKSHAVKLSFQEDWNALVKQRCYLAVVEGVPEQKSDTIHSWLHETSTHLVYSGSKPGGLEAVTRYTVLSENGTYALLDVQIETGRKNQIRVHMKELGHPIAGDKQYGATTNPLGRLGLHAGKLVLSHPVTGKELSFSAKAPKEFRRLFA